MILTAALIAALLAVVGLWRKLSTVENENEHLRVEITRLRARARKLRV